MLHKLWIFSALLFLFCSCGGKKTTSEPPPENSDSQKIENLNGAMSRAQSRIEEMDAKLSALSDKVEALRITLDNLTGNKPVSSEYLGKAKTEIEATELIVPKKVSKITRENLHEANATKSNANLTQYNEAILSFKKALDLFKSGKYSEAEPEFHQFTETYPEHVLAGSAQFYDGESYFMMGEYKLALNEYNKVLSSFLSSPRVASAMVRLSHCYSTLGNTKESEQALDLAKNLFDGNPSLDWLQASSPKKVTTNPLTPVPIEATGEHEDAKEKSH